MVEKLYQVLMDLQILLPHQQQIQRSLEMNEEGSIDLSSKISNYCFTNILPVLIEVLLAGK